MFKELGIIESYGTGVGEAKRACADNGNMCLRYKIFDENANITSVVIPCNTKYCELTKQKLRTEGQKLRTQMIIRNSKYSKRIKDNLDKICVAYQESIFGPKEIIELLGISPNTATSYLVKFIELGLVDKVEGAGQSKYRFKM